jgi:transcriptional regulator with XRE-family HTH domain
MTKKFARLRERMPLDRQARAKGRAEAILAAMPLQELRRARTLSQQTLAKDMNTSQGEISKLEHRTDAYISTLRSYVEAMHGRLRIIAEFPEGTYEITQFEELEEAASGADAG